MVDIKFKNKMKPIKVMSKQLKIDFNEGDDLQVRAYNESTMDAKLSSKYWNVPFVNEVEEFNETMGKPNNYHPTIPEKKDWMFVYDFIQEELAEYKEACERGDIVEVLDALCDITYVSLGNGTMLHGLKGHIWKAYKEVQASNMSKSCEDIQVAEDTVKVRSEQQGEPCHWEKVGNRYVVYRTRDRKVMKSVNYFRPDLKQFFTKEDLDNV